MSRRKRTIKQNNLWPGFVDSLATILLVLMFLLSIFSITQYTLSQTIKARNTTIGNFKNDNKKLSQEKLNLEDKNSKLTSVKDNLLTSIEDYRHSLLQKNQQVLSLTQTINSLTKKSDLQLLSINKQTKKLDENQIIINKINSHISSLKKELLESNNHNASLQNKIGLNTKEITTLQNEIKQFVSQQKKGKNLTDISSEFYKKLLQNLKHRDDVQIVNDRFIFASDIFFKSCSANIQNSALTSLGKIANTIIELNNTNKEKIRHKDLSWVLRIDGHADASHLSSQCKTKFSSNRALSLARALAVADELINRNVRPENILVAGYGEYKPLVNGNDEASLAKNRRIEFRITPR